MGTDIAYNNLDITKMDMTKMVFSKHRKGLRIMRIKRNMAVLMAVVFIFTAGTASAVSVMFYDDFESYRTSSQLNWSPPTGSPWTVMDGTIDLIKSPNSWGLQPAPVGGSFFLDLDGSTNNAGLLMSIDLGNLSSVTAGGPGPFADLTVGQTYWLSFIMAGNQRSGSDNVDIGILIGGDPDDANVLMPIYGLAANSPWTGYSTSFTYAAGDKIFFNNLGGDNIGALLDNVKITTGKVHVPVPEPVSMVMLGCLGGGMFAARKLRRKQTK